MIFVALLLVAQLATAAGLALAWGLWRDRHYYRSYRQHPSQTQPLPRI